MDCRFHFMSWSSAARVSLALPLAAFGAGLALKVLLDLRQDKSLPPVCQSPLPLPLSGAESALAVSFAFGASDMASLYLTIHRSASSWV